MPMESRQGAVRPQGSSSVETTVKFNAYTGKFPPQLGLPWIVAIQHRLVSEEEKRNSMAPRISFEDEPWDRTHKERANLRVQVVSLATANCRLVLTSSPKTEQILKLNDFKHTNHATNAL